MEEKASKLTLFKRALSISLINIWRNKILSIATIFVIGTILFIFNIILAINFITNQALEDLNQKIDITVYLKETTDYNKAMEISEELESLEGIIEVEYSSKEDALIEIKETHPNISIAFEKYKLGNPLPASLNIITNNPKYHPLVDEYLKQDKFKAYLSTIITEENNGSSGILTSVSNNLVKLNKFTNQIIFWLIMTFVVGGTLIILNALQMTIFTRKKEISIMKLVGAPYSFIRMPFIIESIIYGLLAVAVSFIMLTVLAKNLAIEGSSFSNYYSNINYLSIFIVESILTIILSVLSSVIAIHDYLQKDLLED